MERSTHVHGISDFSATKMVILLSFTANGPETMHDGWKRSRGYKVIRSAFLWMPTSWAAYHGQAYARTTCRPGGLPTL